MTYLYLDIETIPTGDEAARQYLASNVEAPANYKDPDKIAAFKAENAEKAWLKSSFDGFFGRVACVGWRLESIDKTYTHTNQSGDDAATISEAVDTITACLNSPTFSSAPVIVGHNVANFDLPFLLRRMVANGIAIPHWWPRNPKPWDQKIVDTMILPGGKDMLSLDHICRALGIPGKDGVTGADVWPMWQAGQFDDIADYCRDDVERVRAVHRRFLEVGW